VGSRVPDRLDDDGGPGDVPGRGKQVVGRGARAALGAALRHLLLERLDLLEQAGDPLAHPAARDAQRPGQLGEGPFLLVDPIQRVPEATDSSPTILNRPTCATFSRCVPPQSSRENSPIWTTRTISGYFSPKRAIAPWARARSIGISDQATGAAASTVWLTRSS